LIIKVLHNQRPTFLRQFCKCLSSKTFHLQFATRHRERYCRGLLDRIL
jgi:hypothetical protein